MATTTTTEKEMFSIERSEFDRLQMQHIELRTANYQLKEREAKITAELTQLQQTVQSQSRELDKANRTVQRSKKAKEFSTLVDENDAIQRKLERQEEDFRLQNRTLMEELSKVCDEKDVICSELEQLKSGGGGGGSGSRVVDQITQLQAENAALLKSMQGMKEKLKETTDNSLNSDGEVDAHPSTAVPSSEERVLELELKLSTEEEVNRILQDKLADVQEAFRKQTAELQRTIEKWTDKMKKKQDSLVQLQEEKERQFHENRAAFDEMVRAKEHEVQSLQANLQQTLRSLDERNATTEMNQDIAKQLDSLLTNKEELNLRTETLTQEKQVLVKGKSELQELLDELGKELQQAKADVGERKKAYRDISAELEEARLSQEQLADQVVKTSEEKHVLVAERDAAAKLAEKRKDILDELSIKRQESATEHLKKSGELEGRYKEELSGLEEQLQQEQSRNWKLTELTENLPALQQKLMDETEKAGLLEGRVTELEETLSAERTERENGVLEIKTLQQEERKEFEERLVGTKAQLEEYQVKIKKLESEMEDKQESVRIVEKKSQNLLKDLKRQLQQMQRKDEKLQEQLLEQRGAQSLYLQSEISYDETSTHSRESSLSSIRGVIRTSEAIDTPGSLSSPLSATANQVPGAVAEETQELLVRIAEIQQEKWLLEEKVHHLESTGSALANDVIQKSEIIRTYFMENRADHQPLPKRLSMADKLSPMKLMAWSRNKEETLEEINRKMQRALEEALTKNIHLQENMSMLSSALEEATNGNEGTQNEMTSDSATSDAKS